MGGSFTPVILKWNFTANSKIVPYLLLSGGGLFTTGNVPPGNTSNFNFMAGGSGGVHVFLCPKRALTLETHWIHISNSELGRNNPNLPANFFSRPAIRGSNEQCCLTCGERTLAR
jgi:hypothetical protein